MSEQNDDGNVGYRKPPRRTRFRKGRSGNPHGRPKGSGNLSPIMDQILSRPMRLRIGGRQIVVTGRQALAMKLVDRAVTGDVRAIGLLQRYGYFTEADEPLVIWFSESEGNF